MDVREKLVGLLQDENNPVWRWFPNNAAMDGILPIAVFCVIGSAVVTTKTVICLIFNERDLIELIIEIKL